MGLRGGREGSRAAEENVQETSHTTGRAEVAAVASAERCALSSAQSLEFSKPACYPPAPAETGTPKLRCQMWGWGSRREMGPMWGRKVESGKAGTSKLVLSVPVQSLLFLFSSEASLYVLVFRLP